MKKGDSTRSGMLWEVERILDECKELNTLPNILFMENVPEVIGKKNIKDFQEWVVKLESLGYSNYVECLNSKDYGIPQNRNRCFMISILGDFLYKFPMPFKLQLRLKDLLENNVDEKYYLSNKMISYISAPNQKWTGNNNGAFINKDIASTLNTGEGSRRCDASNYVSDDLPDNFNLQDTNKIMVVGKSKSGGERSLILDEDGICNCLSATDYKQPKQILIRENTKKGYTEAHDGDGVYINRPHQKRGVVQKGMIQTLKTSPDVGVVVESQYSEYSLKKIKGNIVQDDVVGTITASAMQSFNHDNCHLVVEENRIYDSESIAMAHPSNLPGGSYKYLVKDKLGNEIPLYKDTKQLKETIKNCELEQGKALNLDLYNRASYEESQTITEPNHNSQRLFDVLRIRKLSTREVFRLMGVKDEDFDKIKINQTDASLYHLAGDSIVVDVMKHIFKNLL